MVNVSVKDGLYKCCVNLVCTFIYPDKRKMHSFFRMYYALQQDKFLGNHT